MVLVAVALLALIGSAALILLAGSVEWQKNQIQELADSTALDSALKIGIGCNAPKANTVITEADNFLATRRTRIGALAIAAGTCATPYKGTDTFAGGLSATYNYPYRAHQQQVEVILTLTLPISFGGELGKTSTTVTRRAVAQQLAGSVPAISATFLNCAGGQVNVAGDVMAQNAITRGGACALYAHTRLDAPSGTYSNLGNISVYADGQNWVGGGRCRRGLNTGSARAICADGAELSGHIAPACGTTGTSAFLSAGVALVDPNPCALGVARPPVPPRSATLPPDPNTDPAIFAKLPGGVPCSPGTPYPQIKVKGQVVGTGFGTATLQPGGGPVKYWHMSPSCYGYLDPSQFKSDIAILDPGFYYFNGSGAPFPGGGGICLNGSQLYAQDVTLEFVNRAGFSSGDCTPGGGGGATCVAPCQFGSTPCSISACPPNAPADPVFGTGFTWFAAPCSQAPAGDASCPASAWCPAGDRACQNLLIYQPAGSTGQIAIISPAVNAWLLGSVFWSGTCTYVINGTSRIDGSVGCGRLSISAAAGAGLGVGSDFGVSTALVEALLVE
jgi:hypothetical protein